LSKEQQTAKSETKKARGNRFKPDSTGFFKKNPGNVRLSHEVALEVSWALKALTTVFGTGTGVSPSL
tara:strand:+ start:337 stop:537 length:201 start_codon:yes stop_codon:yes gene_type:complete